MTTGERKKSGLLGRLFGSGPRRAPALVTDPAPRRILARLPSRYLVDTDASVTVAHTYGLVRFEVHQAVLARAQKGVHYFCTVSIGKQSWATRDARAPAAPAALEYEQSSEFVLQRSGATIIRLALFRRGKLDNHLEAWCEVDLAAYFAQPPPPKPAAPADAADEGAASGPVVAGEFDLLDPSDPAVILGSVKVSGHASSLAQLEQQVWSSLLTLADFDGNGALCEAELGALLRAFGADLAPAELKDIFLEADADGSGRVDAAELAQALAVGSRFHRLLRRCPVDGAQLSENPDDEASNLVYVALALAAARQGAGAGVGNGEMRGGYSTQAQAARSWVLNLSEWAAHPLAGKAARRRDLGGLRVGRQAAHILVYDRQRKMVVEEAISPVLTLAMKNMYQSKVGRALMRQGLAKKLVPLSVREGRARDSPESARDIRPFVEGFRGEINVEEAELALDEYKTFNQFFYRRLKPGARPVASPGDADVVVSAADCRLQVYESVDEATRFWVKGRNFSVAGLLADTDPERPLASQFDNGTMAIFRLAPQDYHRFHSPVAGTVVSLTDVPGGLLTVNPIAVNSSFCNVFTENKRSVALLQAPGWGLVAFVAIGATLVGSINWTVAPGEEVEKGAELGYFAFGGSTCIALLPDAAPASWDADLLANSRKSLETLVRVGERVGVRRGSAMEAPAKERASLSQDTAAVAESAGVVPLEERPEMRELAGAGSSDSQGGLTSVLAAADSAPTEGEEDGVGLVGAVGEDEDEGEDEGEAGAEPPR